MICYPLSRRGCYATRLPLRLERIKSLAVTTKGANRTAEPKTSDATAASNGSPGHHMKGLQACLPPPNKILPRMRLASMALASLGRQSSKRQRSCPCPKYCAEGSAVHTPTRIPDSEILQHGSMTPQCPRHFLVLPLIVTPSPTNLPPVNWGSATHPPLCQKNPRICIEAQLQHRRIAKAH